MPEAPEYRSISPIRTFIVYADDSTDSSLTLPTNDVDVPDRSKSNVLSLVESSARGLTQADSNEHIAHVYVRQDTGSIVGFELLPQFL